MMTRKHYVALAAALKEARTAATYRGANDRDSQLISIGVDLACREIADALAADNGRFDRDRFARAAGIDQ